MGGVDVFRTYTAIDFRHSVGANQRDPLDWICGIGIAAFVLYQIIDSIRTAKALQVGQPAPDPFGLATMFSPGGDKGDFARGVPTGAVVLIGCSYLGGII